METALASHDFDGFTKNLILTTLFFIATPIVIISSLISLTSLSNIRSKSQERVDNNGVVLSFSDSEPVQVLSALPAYNFGVTSSVDSSDARTDLISQYLGYFNSPLKDYAHYIVQISDTYGIDYRLLSAIAQQESNLCKVIPKDSYNCWGWGIHSRGSLRFSNYEEAIDTVAKGLKEEYIDKGYINPEEIMAKYTPMSQGSWALGVTHFMDEMENGVK